MKKPFRHSSHSNIASKESLLKWNILFIHIEVVARVSLGVEFSVRPYIAHSLLRSFNANSFLASQRRACRAQVSCKYIFYYEPKAFHIERCLSGF